MAERGVSRRPARLRRVALLAALLAAGLTLVGGGAGRVARADEASSAAAGRGFAPLDEASWRAEDGRLRRLYRPRFVPAESLLADALALGVAGVEMALDARHARLLLTAPEAGFGVAEDALDWLDVPQPSVLVEVGIVETVSRCNVESGGHGLFDRGSQGPNTFFRGLRSDFEPDSWLRSELLGTRPFEGASLDLARDAPGGPLSGTLELVLRRLSHRGEADFLANPSLVCTEGVPAEMRATIELPVTIFGRADVVVNNQTVVEKAGVELRVTALKVGADQVTLHIHPWLRQLAMARAPGGPESYPVLAIRELDTTVTLADGEEIVLGGLEAIDRANGRTGIPGLERLPAIDSVLSGRHGEHVKTDILFHVRVRILRPGRAGVAIMPPGEIERLERRAREAPPRAGPRLGGTCAVGERWGATGARPAAALAPVPVPVPATTSAPTAAPARQLDSAMLPDPLPKVSRPVSVAPSALPPPRWIRGGGTR